MKVVTIVLLVISIAIVNTSSISDDTHVTTKRDEHDVTVTSSSEEKRSMRPIFPKSGKIFALTTKSTNAVNVTSPVQINRATKKPVFKIITKAVKMKSSNYWKTTTRPVLMKLTKFTVNPLNTINIHKHSINSNKQSGKDEDVERKHKPNKIKDDDSSEEVTETSAVNEKRKDKNNNVKTLVRRFHKLGSKISRGKSAEAISKSKETADKLVTHKDDKIKPSEAQFSSEEKEDRNEFIFVTTKKIEEHTVRNIRDSDESDENTTVTLEKELKPRQKRSINVIEEENLGTTISGFKFTGKVASLSSDLVFRNINT